MSEEVPDLGAVLMREIAAVGMAGISIWRELAERRSRHPADDPLDVELSKAATHYTDLSRTSLGQADEDLVRARELLQNGDVEGSLAAMVDHTRHLGEAAHYGVVAEQAGRQAVEVVKEQTPAFEALRTARETVGAARQAGNRTVERAAVAGLVTTTGARAGQGRVGVGPNNRPQVAATPRQAPTNRRP